MRFTALLLALLAGCASLEQNVDDAKASWFGATYDEVVLRWGTPQRSTQLAGNRYAYTWSSEEVVPRGALWPSIGIFGGSGGVGIGTGVTVGGLGGGELTRCERTLIFRDGRVAEQIWHGPPDYCAKFRRA